MTKINNENLFNYAPTIKTPRSRFLMHQNIRTSFNAGKLIPFFVDSDIMPGDTFKIRGTFVCRQTTPIYPTMDNSFLDIFFFFIPHRLVWNHWKEFWGENNTGAWTQTNQYSVPQMLYGKHAAYPGIDKGDIATLMGLPILTSSSDGCSVSALPFRAYIDVWNSWFRDENVAAPMYNYTGDSNQIFIAENNKPWGTYDTQNTHIPLTPAPVYKYKDYYNACLIEPQKGGPISLPLGTVAPVYGNGKALGVTDGTLEATLCHYQAPNATAAVDTFQNGIGLAVGTAGGSGQATTGTLGVIADATKSGLIADLSNAVAATINAQRMAFAAQRILEARARTGSRYIEIIQATYSVTSVLNAVLQRPEYCGGKHIPISIQQIPQTSSTDSTSPQGNMAGFSLTVDTSHFVNKSFVEHGTLMGLLCVRTEHSYDSGISRMWSRKNVLDFYQPQLAFLGEQAVLNKEIYATGTSQDNSVFGYNERWAEYRYKPNINTGAFSTRYAQSLSAWHYGDSYASLPVLSDAWRRETAAFIDRTLAVQSAVEDQYILDCRLDFDAIRPLPISSIPGLLDHF